ncbi:PLDc N-terminal domain-containing protein [Rhodococcus sp. IEGM 1318]|uniref:PLDc N-terminal domain-containing protein n=1 Tax=Rhodococcus sp. IEGM 1318 TaxID=3082226 RepID=UPI0029538421|nr:PLDc N-terminal domain-containing protein [Rhodococcus sp. IEGM 1318]MDV8007005.1 PLDc N-terminal domain-containing protein [Rhodococcus sp. IEGM 1318]
MILLAGSAATPTIPLEYDLTWTALVVAFVALTVAALVSIFRTPHDRMASKFWWSALAVAFPIVGAVVWFIFGAPPLRRRAQAERSS